MSSPNEQEQHTNGIWWEDPNKAKEKDKVNKNGDTFTFSGAVYSWLSKLMTRLRLLCFVIVSKVLYQLFKYWEPKPIASCTWDFSGSLSKLQVISRNSFWFNALLAEDKITDNIHKLQPHSRLGAPLESGTLWFSSVQEYFAHSLVLCLRLLIYSLKKNQPQQNHSQHANIECL